MKDSSPISHVNYGDSTIDTNNFNRLVDGVNKLERSGISGDALSYESEDNISSISLTNQPTTQQTN